jgi:glyoxylase-like metal-dependent hydrolase (beta-lactamase superfamily II)
VILRQYLHEEPVVAISYLLGCGSKGLGVVVDPVEEPRFYLEEAGRLGLRIAYVLDTHVHADHISTGRALAERSGAPYVLWKGTPTGYGFFGVEEGEVLEVGNVRLTVWHTPGHTPEHLTLLVTDRTRGEEPWMALTGHTLMVGDLGRTELETAAEEGARALYRSARRLAALPDYVEVYPGAFSGSVCGRGLSGKPVSTIGFERRHNRAFALATSLDEAGFVAHMLKDLPPPPPNHKAIRAANLGLGV